MAVKSRLIMATFVDAKGFSRKQMIPYPPRPCFEFAVMPSMQAAFHVSDVPTSTAASIKTVLFRLYSFEGMFAEYRQD